MQHLFTPEGLAALARVLQRDPLLAFDFDGTLAPIVSRPADACIPPAVSARLAALAARWPVAIVTGRSVADVRTRLGFVPRFIVGNHGAQDDAEPPPPAALSAALDGLRARLHARQAELAQAGVTVEDKGLSIALHYRQSQTRALALDLIATLVAEHDAALRIFGGKRVVNVVPRQAPDKAQAMLSLVARCGAACALFAGDDLNDEPVFEAAPPDWLTILVGPGRSRSSAMYFLDRPLDMAAALDAMLAMRR